MAGAGLTADPTTKLSEAYTCKKAFFITFVLQNVSNLSTFDFYTAKGTLSCLDRRWTKTQCPVEPPSEGGQSSAWSSILNIK
jgi:hypothetical protein